MADLALFKDKGPTSLTDISLRQNIVQESGKQIAR